MAAALQCGTTAMALNRLAARLDLNSVTMCKGEV
jgi:hypothetical protein